WCWRVGLGDARRCVGEKAKAREPARERGRIVERSHAGGEGAAGQHRGTHHQRRRTARALTGEQPVILPEPMLGIRPDWLRMHRKAQRPAMGAFRAATMHQYFSATNFLPVSDAMSSSVSSCVPRGDLTAAMLGRARSVSAA